ncbi:hypothetical protein STEG23_036178, partial [Scotinomys teguina]
MAAELEPLTAEWLGVEEAEDAGGQATSLTKTEDLLEMVKRLQKEGNLEPQIEDLIHRINELQQAKKRSSEELGETQALQEAMHQELDSLNEEKGHLEEVLCKKQEALLILQKHCQKRESETRWLNAKERLEDLAGQRKDLWEFHVLQQRLTQEISTMECSKDQLLMERTLLRAQLQEVERRLQMARETQNTPGNCGLKMELEKFGGQSQSIPDTQNNGGEANVFSFIEVAAHVRTSFHSGLLLVAVMNTTTKSELREGRVSTDMLEAVIPLSRRVRTGTR